MKKKNIVLIVIFFGWIIYRDFTTPVEKIIVIDSDSKIASHDAETQFISNSKSEGNDKNLKEKINSKINTKDELNFSEFDKIEKEWLSKVQEVIGKENIQAYLSMRSKNDDEKLIAYNDHHAKLREKFGNKLAYNISDDQSAEEKKINQRYLNDLLKLIGPEKFKDYTAIKDKMNEVMRIKNQEMLQIEF